MKAPIKAYGSNAPKPVRPLAVNHHGLFGTPYVRQHMMVDEHWTMNSLTEEFKGMSDLLSKRVICQKLEAKAARHRELRENRDLKRQCRDGRVKLQMVKYDDTAKTVKHYLTNHREMQRLYRKMPVQLVMDNINQRTFVMRKERDRLRFRLEQLNKEYESKLLQRAELENRIKFRDEFVLEEEIKSREYMKKVANSNVRLNAIKTINCTYKKMLEVLQHDSIFYEPILNSLDNDIEDQSKFIKHILYMGIPAIAKFNDWSEEYRKLEEQERRDIRTKLQCVASLKKNLQQNRSNMAKVTAKPTVTAEHLRRYVRETESMRTLRYQLDDIETAMKNVKFATLSSQVKEIYSNIKNKVDNNVKLQKVIGNDALTHQNLDMRMKYAEVLEGVLINNLSEAEIGRMERIKTLKKSIANQDDLEASTMAHIKNRANIYVVIRFSLWQLYDILRHVDEPLKKPHITYPNSYLKLPLLKFEMVPMRAVAPLLFEENTDTIMHDIKHKVRKLMSAYKILYQNGVKDSTDEYHYTFLDSWQLDDAADQSAPLQAESVHDVLEDTKFSSTVPSRKVIKDNSAKLVDELSKKED